MNPLQTDLERDNFDLPDKGRNLIKQTALVVAIPYLVMILITVAICNADKIDKAFQNLFLWLTT